MKIGFIGAGNMGSALAKAVKLSGADVFIYDKDTKKAEALACEIGAQFMNNIDIAEKCDQIYLAVKPNIIPYAVGEIKQMLEKRSNAPLLISMAAGISLASLEEPIPTMPIIRIMPNTPAAVGEGLILWCGGKHVTDTKAESFVSSISPAGKIFRIDEKLIDAASAVSGCGPAFVYIFIEALADGAVSCGLPRALATEFAAQTVLGAAKNLLVSKKHPGELKDAVCSPGGSTIEGVLTLENGAFRADTAEAVRASYEKTLILGKK